MEYKIIGNNFNILIDKLPECVEIDNVKYPINTDFRHMILVSMNIQEKLIPDVVKIQNIIDIFYKDIPLNFPKAVDKLFDFYLCGQKPTQKKDDNDQSPLFDFHQDAMLIYAAFYQQYKIDLTVEKMHWFKFKALFDGLSEDTKFKQIVSIRGQEIDDNAPIEYRKKITELKEMVSLKKSQSLEEMFAEELEQKELRQRLVEFQKQTGLKLYG